MATAKPGQETARMFDERYEQQKAWHVFVAHARRTSKPLFYVRSPSGCTLDCVATILEARSVRNKEPKSAIFVLKMAQLTRIE